MVREIGSKGEGGGDKGKEKEKLSQRDKELPQDREETDAAHRQMVV